MKETTDIRLFKRYQNIYLCLKGYKQKDIAEIILRSKKLFSLTPKSLKKDVLDRIKLWSYPGAPRKLTEEAKLVQVVACQTPHGVGYENNYNWTFDHCQIY